MHQQFFNQNEFETLKEEIRTGKSINATLLNSLPWPAMLIRQDRKIIATNVIAEESGVVIGSFCWDTFGKKASISDNDREYFEKNNSVPPEGIKCIFCEADNALETQKTVNKKIPAGDITYDTYWVPLTDDVYLHYAFVSS